jgi:hypothetical protein
VNVKTYEGEALEAFSCVDFPESISDGTVHLGVSLNKTLVRHLGDQITYLLAALDQVKGAN